MVEVSDVLCLTQIFSVYVAADHLSIAQSTALTFFLLPLRGCSLLLTVWTHSNFFEVTHTFSGFKPLILFLSHSHFCFFTYCRSCRSTPFWDIYDNFDPFFVVERSSEVRNFTRPIINSPIINASAHGFSELSCSLWHGSSSCTATPAHALLSVHGSLLCFDIEIYTLSEVVTLSRNEQWQFFSWCVSDSQKFVLATIR